MKETREAWRRAPVGAKLAAIFLRVIGFFSLMGTMAVLVLAIYACLAASNVDGSAGDGLMVFVLLGILVLVLGFLYAMVRACDLLAWSVIVGGGAAWVREWMGDLRVGVPWFVILFFGTQLLATGLVLALSAGREASAAQAALALADGVTAGVAGACLRKWGPPSGRSSRHR